MIDAWTMLHAANNNATTNNNNVNKVNMTMANSEVMQDNGTQPRTNDQAMEELRRTVEHLTNEK